MKRRGRHFRIAAGALLGLATTVGVAWSLARWKPIPMYPRTVMRAFMLGGRAWTGSEVRLPGVNDIWWMDLEFDARQRAAMTPRGALDLIAPAPAQQQFEQSRDNLIELAKQRPGSVALTSPPWWGSFTQPETLPPFDRAGEDSAFGLPLPCMWYRVVGAMRGSTTYGGPVEGGILITGEPGPRGSGSYRALPLRLIWPAFVLDWFAFTVLWWILLMIPSAVRGVVRSRRARRGLCPICRYDLRGTPAAAPCPECGRAETGSGSP